MWNETGWDATAYKEIQSFATEVYAVSAALQFPILFEIADFYVGGEDEICVDGRTLHEWAEAYTMLVNQGEIAE